MDFLAQFGIVQDEIKIYEKIVTTLLRLEFRYVGRAPECEKRRAFVASFFYIGVGLYVSIFLALYFDFAQHDSQKRFSLQSLTREIRAESESEERSVCIANQIYFSLNEFSHFQILLISHP